MEYAPFLRKQLQWAKRHSDSAADEERAAWWLAEIKKLEAKEAKAFPPEPAPEQAATPEHTAHPHAA
ncbi:MAG: hypothetical protein K0R17_1033 [Rariglobus sp.]|jgi:hypothetical protein|nr:hypothetical protein [Rariglobus sp.]